MHFRDLLRQHHVETRGVGEHHHATEGFVNFDCPWCSPHAKAFRMGYSLHGRFVNCWVCGHHNLLSTLAKACNVSVEQIKKQFQGLVHEVEKAWIPAGKLRLPTPIAPLQSGHKRYLKQRGFDPEQLTRLWNIQGIDWAGGAYAWTIYIPVYYGGEVVSWTTRATTDAVKKRYRNAPRAWERMPASHLLYGEEYARHSIIINEGPLDAWAIGPGAVATCGVGISAEQITKMSKYSTRVVCFDNEPLAQKRARKLCNQLSVLPGTTYNVTLSGKDASRSPQREIKELRKRFLDT